MWKKRKYPKKKKTLFYFSCHKARIFLVTGGSGGGGSGGGSPALTDFLVNFRFCPSWDSIAQALDVVLETKSKSTNQIFSFYFIFIWNFYFYYYIYVGSWMNMLFFRERVWWNLSRSLKVGIFWGLLSCKGTNLIWNNEEHNYWWWIMLDYVIELDYLN